jgi:hypothetical protein
VVRPGCISFLGSVNGYRQITELITINLKNPSTAHCASGAQETMEHLLRCPAFIDKHVYLKQIVKSKFDYWKIPYSKFSFVSREYGLRCKWKAAARQRFSAETIHSSRLDILTNGFWKANQSKPLISTRNFLDNLSKVINNPETSPFLNALPRQDILSMLIQEFSLQMHGSQILYTSLLSSKSGAH